MTNQTPSLRAAAQIALEAIESGNTLKLTRAVVALTAALASPGVAHPTRTPVREAGLTTFSTQTLLAAGFTHLEDAATLTDQQLLTQHHIGRKVLAELRRRMAAIAQAVQP